MTSSSGTSNGASRSIIVGTTIAIGAGAVILVFMPAELASLMGVPPSDATNLILQLYGAALFGLAMTGWMVRGAVVGGVFGRSYVLGNAAHAFVGALTLIRPAIAHGAPLALQAVTAVYWLLAIVFGYLLFVAAPGSR